LAGQRFFCLGDQDAQEMRLQETKRSRLGNSGYLMRQVSNRGILDNSIFDSPLDVDD
jgi:hypothetical protein